MFINLKKLRFKFSSNPHSEEKHKIRPSPKIYDILQLSYSKPTLNTLHLGDDETVEQQHSNETGRKL